MQPYIYRLLIREWFIWSWDFIAGFTATRTSHHTPPPAFKETLADLDFRIHTGALKWVHHMQRIVVYMMMNSASQTSKRAAIPLKQIANALDVCVFCIALQCIDRTTWWPNLFRKYGRLPLPRVVGWTFTNVADWSSRIRDAIDQRAMRESERAHLAPHAPGGNIFQSGERKNDGDLMRHARIPVPYTQYYTIVHTHSHPDACIYKADLNVGNRLKCTDIKWLGGFV